MHAQPNQVANWQPGQVLTESEALRFATRGTSATVEVRGRLTSKRILCDLIAGFANCAGGMIIFGYHEHKGRVVGCNRTRLQRRFEEAVEDLATKCMASLHFYPVQDHRLLGVVYVPPHLIATRPVIRDGTHVRAMTKQEVLKLVLDQHRDPAPHALAALIVVLNEKIRRLEEELERANSLCRQVRNGLIGAATTAVFGYVVGLVQVPKWWPWTR